jgi:hypothetical protein
VRAQRGHRLARWMVEDEQKKHRHRARRPHRQSQIVHAQNVPLLREAFCIPVQAVQHPRRPSAHHRPQPSAGMPGRRRRGELPQRPWPPLGLGQVHAPCQTLQVTIGEWSKRVAILAQATAAEGTKGNALYPGIDAPTFRSANSLRALQMPIDKGMGGQRAGLAAWW